MGDDLPAVRRYDVGQMTEEAETGHRVGCQPKGVGEDLLANGTDDGKLDDDGHVWPLQRLTADGSDTLSVLLRKSLGKLAREDETSALEKGEICGDELSFLATAPERTAADR